jgi:hypothetical protein
MPKPKPKFDTSIIDVHDVEESASIGGIKETVLHFRDGVRTPFYDPSSYSEQVSDAHSAKRGTPHLGTPALDTPSKGALSLGPPIIGTQDKDTLSKGTPVPSSPSEAAISHGTPRRDNAKNVDQNTDLQMLAALGLTVDPPQLKPAVLAQDAHTQSEELLYGKMWAKGVPQPGMPCRILTIGLKKLTALVRMVKTDSCRNNLDGLIQKLAIEDLGVAPNPNHGHVYRIWDQGAILRRRRENGLTHYYRMRRAVYLVNPTLQNEVPFPGVPSNGVPNTGSPQKEEPSGGFLSYENGGPHTGAPDKQFGVPSNGQSGVPSNGPLLIRNRNFQEDVSRSELPEIVVDALLSVMGDCDDETVRRIVRAARAARPDVPDQVIVQIIHMKGPRIRANTKLDYPLRVLEIALAETVQGVTGANLCKAYSKAAATQSREGNYESVLSDPDASEQEKDLVRRIIGDATESR